MLSLMHYRHNVSILEDPEAARWDDAIFSGENLLREPRRANVNFRSDTNSSCVFEDVLCPACKAD